MEVELQRPSRRREAEFLAAVRVSRASYRSLVSPPDSSERYRRFIASGRRRNQEHFLIVHRQDRALVGVVEISNIVRGVFESACLGYYAFEPYQGKGLMREGLSLVIDHAFRNLKLHRLEANIQPENERSVRLVRGSGFSLEGYSRRFLKISGRWRDHERWAVLSKEWRATKPLQR